MPAIKDYNTTQIAAYQLSESQSFRLKNYMWQWFYEHAEDVVVEFRTPIISIKILTVRVKNLRVIFELLFGKEESDE